MSQRASNFLVVPLCPEHHTGNSGLHGLGERGFYTRYKLSELDLLAMTIEELHENLYKHRIVPRSSSLVHSK